MVMTATPTRSLRSFPTSATAVERVSLLLIATVLLAYRKRRMSLCLILRSTCTDGKPASRRKGLWKCQKPKEKPRGRSWKGASAFLIAFTRSSMFSLR